ncbi:hypothetical protein [Altererythrobacter sp. Z27]|uniref:hypothetical protein n=1 Tax=Altererythrobacter sp. Z27 TaxID=3461147 RepID=UPI0040439728
MFAALLGILAGGTALPPDISEDIAATRIVAASGDAVWPGFTSAPFSFLFVTEEAEYLLCDSRTPAGFEALGQDAATGCSVKQGPTSWRRPALLAAMPIFGPGEVIAMGSPDATGLSRAAWRRTILHEHFHQWQGQLPGYYDRTEALDLSDGDQSGMWMIQYPFPYQDRDVATAYRAAADALLAALNASDQDLLAATQQYLAKRTAFATAAGDRNWRYYDFQLWKEGVARWTEVEIARRAGGEWSVDAEAYWSGQLENLRSRDLPDMERVSVYAFGAAEAALLERIDPDWRGCYRVTLQLGDCWASLGVTSSVDD